MIRCVLPALLLNACMVASVDPGTAVGNPPDAMVRLAPSNEVDVEGGTLTGGSLAIAPCDLARPVEVIALDSLDLLDAPAINLPATQVCGARLMATEIRLSLSVGGQAPEELLLTAVELDLGPDDPAQLPWLDDGQHFILELGSPGWLDGLTPSIEGGDPLSPASVGYPSVSSALATESAVWEDLDESGVIEDVERTVPTLDAGQPPVREAEDEEEDEDD